MIVKFYIPIRTQWLLITFNVKFKRLYDDFIDFDIFESVLERHAPQKSRYIRGNEKPHMNKALRTAIMKRTHLRNIYRKSRNISD